MSIVYQSKSQSPTIIVTRLIPPSRIHHTHRYCSKTCPYFMAILEHRLHFINQWIPELEQDLKCEPQCIDKEGHRRGTLAMIKGFGKDKDHLEKIIASLDPSQYYEIPAPARYKQTMNHVQDFFKVQLPD